MGEFPLSNPWTDGEELDAAILYDRITSKINDLAALSSQGRLGSAISASTVTLTSAATDYAGLAVVTFTLATQRRVKITTIVRFDPGTSATGRYLIKPGYNSGSSASIGSFASSWGTVGWSIPNDGTNNRRTGSGVTDELLAAGTYTAYAAITRVSGGDPTDLGGWFYTLVEDIGST